MSDPSVVITPYQDGPYLIRGQFELQDQTGATIPISGRVVALCRCGRSRIRPFCDGSHHLVRFRAESAAEDRTSVSDEQAPTS